MHNHMFRLLYDQAIAVSGRALISSPGRDTNDKELKSISSISALAAQKGKKNQRLKISDCVLQITKNKKVT